jgi:predicted CXXCH cytochrome family protein
VNDQQKLCRACHPLLSGTEERENKEKGEDLHDYYLGLFGELVPDQEMTCSYCHGEDHSKKVKEKGIVTCYQCHNYIEKLVNSKKGRTKNIHETLKKFAGNNCTLCHNPHSSPFPDLLKEERESYK